jgi:hypothetical protein
MNGGVEAEDATCLNYLILTVSWTKTTFQFEDQLNGTITFLQTSHDS